ncbi:MAG: hypothetical protein HY961_14730 [Ignavibacteriae bacterium]|nr:hypothetical protein [Ignavibacteriota bacterium]
MWQRDFRLGAIDYRDQYLVQMFRLNFTFNYGDNVKAITRFDLGQGWWGVDNQQPTYVGSGSGTFDNKDSKFFLHVDQAYLWFNVADWSTAFSIGRFQWAVGNRLVLDNNYDGVAADFNIATGALKLGWSRVSEGLDGLSDLERTGADQRGNFDGGDADLFLASYSLPIDKTKLELYGMYYLDGSTADTNAYLIDGLFYNRPRFTPQVTSLGIVGLSGNSKVSDFTLTYEGNVLFGKDDIANTTFAGHLNTSAGTAKNDPLKYDKNNGKLFGYNAYLKVDYAVAPAFTLGFVGGMGSGDADPTSGKGNVNKLRTAGFFYITEVWEDSIMPDEEGITPQGLGAPNIRGYRELENTTIFQLNGTYAATNRLKLFASVNYIRATKPVFAWTAAGPNLALSAKDLGFEVDAKADYKIMDNLTATLRGGVFTPGKAAKYLINGSDKWDRTAYEMRSEITFTF